MYKGELADRVESLGAVDWSRMPFDSLAPLPPAAPAGATAGRHGEAGLMS